MSKPKTTYTEQVGILVGNILPDSPPIVFNLYIRANGRGHVRMQEGADTETPLSMVQALMRGYGRVALSLWKLQGDNGWYYIELCEGCSPADVMRPCPFPWAALGRWRKVHVAR